MRWSSALAFAALSAGVWGAVFGEGPELRAAGTAVTALVALLVGIGVGDRARLAYCRELVRANALLVTHVRECAESTLVLISKREGEP